MKRGRFQEKVGKRLDYKHVQEKISIEYINRL